MGRDSYERRIKCPCGKGEIIQISESDDWNRFSEWTPEIVCPECKNKYKVISKTFTDNKGETWTKYYLVLKSFEYDKIRKNIYENLKYESDFSEYLIVHYSKKLLEEAYDTLINSTSVASLKGEAYRIALDKKKKTGSCKIGELTTFVKKAIDGFDSYVGNWQQRYDEKQENIKIDQENFEKVKREGICLNI